MSHRLQRVLLRLAAFAAMTATSPWLLRSPSPGRGAALLFAEASSSSSSSSLTDCSVEDELVGMNVLGQFEKCSGLTSAEIQAVYNTVDADSITSSSSAETREALLAKAAECSETPQNEVADSYGGERDICVAGYMKLMAEDGFFPDEDLLTSCTCLEEYVGKLPDCGIFSSVSGDQSVIATTTGLCGDVPAVCDDVKLFATECLDVTYRDSVSGWAAMAIQYASHPTECHAVQFKATHCPSTASLVWEAGSTALAYCVSSPSGLTKAEYAAVSSFNDACPHYFTESYTEPTATATTATSSKYNYDITTYPPLLLVMMAAIIGAGCYFILRRRRASYNDLKDPNTYGATLFSGASQTASHLGFRRKGEPVYSAVSTDDAGGGASYTSRASRSSASPSASPSRPATAASPVAPNASSDLEKGMFGGVLGTPFGGGGGGSASAKKVASPGGGYGAYGEANPLASSADDDDENSFTM